MIAEAEEQRVIQCLIDQDDRALSEWDIDGMFSNATPDYVDITRGRTTDLASIREEWIKGYPWVEITSTSEITGFVLIGDNARVKYTSHFWTRLKSPRWLSKVLIITDEFFGSEYVKTSDGWLCKSGEHLKTRLRGIKWQNPGRHLVTEPGQLNEPGS